MTQPSLSDIVSCLSGYDPDALPVSQAQQIIRQFVSPIHAVEKVAIRSALNRVLAQDITSPINVPAHDNSAMDGYALRGADLAQDKDLVLRVKGTAFAGRAYEGTVDAGECVQIMTGAVMPSDCDTVVPQEFVRNASEQQITVPAGAVKAGDNPPGMRHHRHGRGEG
jgi:molybdopterin molybdotransferase